LEYSLVYDYTQWVVLPTAPVSPLGMFVRKMIGADGVGGQIGFRLVRGSAELPLLEWQERRGYNGVPQSCFKLLREETVKVPEELLTVCRGEMVGEGGANDADVMSLLLHRHPTMPHVDMKGRLKKRHARTEEDVGAVRDAVDEDVLTCLMLHQDYLETKDWVKGEEKASSASTEQKRKINARVNTFLMRAAPVLGDRRPKMTAAQRKKAEEEEDRPVMAPLRVDARWRANIACRDHSIVERLKPPSSAIYWDVTNGAWKCLYAGVPLRPGSFSCHNMGPGFAMRAALYRVWDTRRRWYAGGPFTHDV
jgi:hypothetical protein